MASGCRGCGCSTPVASPVVEVPSSFMPFLSYSGPVDMDMDMDMEDFIGKIDRKALVPHPLVRFGHRGPSSGLVRLRRFY